MALIVKIDGGLCEEAYKCQDLRVGSNRLEVFPI
jgi:hypothetical protein